MTGVITLGVMQQIVRAFGREEISFQYLVSSWTTIVELISVYKRLRAFEHRIGGAGACAPSGIVRELITALESIRNTAEAGKARS